MDHGSEIPIIDVAAMLAGEEAAEARVADQILAACTSTGFFYLAGHGVDQAMIDDAFEANRRFHAKPVAEKLAVKQNRWHRGYQPFASSTLKSSARFEAARHPNQLESFFVRHELSPNHPDYERKALQGPNQWPDDPWFIETVRRYDTATRNLGLSLLPAFSRAVGEDRGFFTRLFDPPASALRLIHYTPAPAVRPEDLYGIHPHTDYGFLTILAQDDVGGLQVQRVDGTWIDAPYIRGTFILNIGDILARWTNDRFNSTPHRVVNKSHEKDRYSIGMFFDPNLDTMIETLPQFADLQPGKYPPIRYGDYFTMRLDANYPDRTGLPAAN
ncbi:isopenicillin N synthase family dioxygenase [Acuticoccus kandeliae]|uniref:isopenicillin N synthase family dioxygenase n=1 Tax=Acuticoccus kandeliae TaxID=2073160 RepID=UPI000D3ED581|nr:2-oxoglutarate and iron-dependent oxygenase domain-containing protein [Acuticoccus kandeliae]